MGTGPYNAENSDGDARRFAAFISYSHADAYAAAKLQRKLERYRLPSRIAKTRDRPPQLWVRSFETEKIWPQRLI